MSRFREKIEEYKAERARVIALFPEARHTTISVPMPWHHYKTRYKSSWLASRMWMGRMRAFAHELDILGSGDNPTPEGEMAIIEALGFGRAFSPEAKAARRKAAEARLVARQKNSYGYRQLIKERKDPKVEAEKAIQEALSYMPDQEKAYE